MADPPISPPRFEPLKDSKTNPAVDDQWLERARKLTWSNKGTIVPDGKKTDLPLGRFIDLPELQLDLGKRPAAGPSDLAAWIRANLSRLNADKQERIQLSEIEKLISDKRFTGRDAEMMAALFLSSPLIDNLGSKDGYITPAEVKLFEKYVMNPANAEQVGRLKEFMQELHERSSSINTKLWGDFKKPIEAVNMQAVGQGAVGDCWLMAVIAAMAEKMPAEIVKMIKENADGTFTVTFPKFPDKPVTVDAPSQTELALFAKANQYGTWVAVLEKATAKILAEQYNLKPKIAVGILHGGLPDKAFELLTGQKTVQLETDAPNLAQMLAVAAQWELPIAAGSRGMFNDSVADDNGVYFRHAYSVTYNAKTKEVTVRNPWGPVARSVPPDSSGRARKNKGEDGALTLTLAQFKESFPFVWVPVP